MNNIILVSFGKNLRKYRKMAGITQEKMAELLDFSVTYVSLLETGKANTSLLMVEKIAKILNIDYVKLLESSENN